MGLYVSSVSFLSCGKGSSFFISLIFLFFPCLKRLNKLGLSTKNNGPRKTVFFCSDQIRSISFYWRIFKYVHLTIITMSIECDLSHPDSVDVENFKLYI